jgi:hypothetical protein
MADDLSDLIERNAAFIAAQHAEHATRQAKKISWTPLPADLMSREFPARPYAVYPYCGRGLTCGLVSVGGLGKSGLILQWCLHVAAGRTWNGHPVTQGTAWYLSVEDDADEIMRRAKRILADFTDAERALALKHFKMEAALGKGLHLVEQSAGAPIATDVAAEIAKTIGKDAVLVALDTVARLNGSTEGNESLSLLVSASDHLARYTGAAVVLAHHVSKEAGRAGTADLHAGRGGSSFGDNCRSIVALIRATEEHMASYDDDTRDAAASGEVVTLVHAKSNYTRLAKPLFLMRDTDGALRAFTPKVDLLAGISAWMHANGRDTFTRREVRGKVSQIWGERRISQRVADKAIADGIASGAVLVDGSRQGGGTMLRMAPGTTDAVASLARVTDETETGDWLS